jgi:hypothetical protein
MIIWDNIKGQHSALSSIKSNWFKAIDHIQCQGIQPKLGMACHDLGFHLSSSGCHSTGPIGLQNSS